MNSIETEYENNNEDREKIEKQVEAYLASGKKITYVENGLGKEDPLKFNTHAWGNQIINLNRRV